MLPSAWDATGDGRSMPLLESFGDLDTSALEVLPVTYLHSDGRQSIELMRERAGQSITCPTCGRPMQFPELTAFGDLPDSSTTGTTLLRITDSPKIFAARQSVFQAGGPIRRPFTKSARRCAEISESISLPSKEGSPPANQVIRTFLFASRSS